MKRLTTSGLMLSNVCLYYYTLIFLNDKEIDYYPVVSKYFLIYLFIDARIQQQYRLANLLNVKSGSFNNINNIS